MALGESSNGYFATILFVDDNAALLKSVERLLRLEGFRVLLASDGHEALRQLETAPHMPDLIISDVAMPNMDGFELFEAVRRRDDWLDIPFLFLTARDQQDDLRRGYSLGADDYLVKPFDQERLLMIIRGKLKRRAELRSRILVQQNALNSAKHDLATMVAHELRTPLVSISMVSDILTREIDSMEGAQVQDMLEVMQGGSARLTRLIEQMVMYIQWQSGALHHVLQGYARACKLHDLALDAIKVSQQFNYVHKETSFHFACRDDHSMVEGDHDTLRQAIVELLMNALIFSAPGTSIVIQEYSADTFACLSITDRGPGIPEAELDRVFEPYYQVNRRRYEQQGIGLGLALARGIVEAHGGTLRLVSAVGHGTQSTIQLPALHA